MSVTRPLVPPATSSDPSGLKELSSVGLVVAGGVIALSAQDGDELGAGLEAAVRRAGGSSAFR
jgi:hypothetical protein